MLGTRDCKSLKETSLTRTKTQRTFSRLWSRMLENLKGTGEDCLENRVEDQMACIHSCLQCHEQGFTSENGRDNVEGWMTSSGKTTGWSARGGEGTKVSVMG